MTSESEMCSILLSTGQQSQTRKIVFTMRGSIYSLVEWLYISFVFAFRWREVLIDGTCPTCSRLVMNGQWTLGLFFCLLDFHRKCTRAWRLEPTLCSDQRMDKESKIIEIPDLFFPAKMHIFDFIKVFVLLFFQNGFSRRNTVRALSFSLHISSVNRNCSRINK